jgi:hypothetical protein
MDAYRELETLVTSISSQIESAIQADEELEKWSKFHGWNGMVNHAVVARQAVLGLVLRAIICRCLSPEMSSGVSSP